jgi:hypothetical protein
MPALFASLVLLMAAEKNKPIKTGTCSGHITNLKQSILETFDIYGQTTQNIDNGHNHHKNYVSTSIQSHVTPT